MMSIHEIINTKLLQRAVGSIGGISDEVASSIGDSAFVAFSQYSNARYAANTYDNNLNFSRYWASPLSASAASELSANNYSYSKTNSTASSATMSASHTPSSSLLGHNSIYIGEDGSISVNNGSLRGQTNVGTWVNGKSGDKSLHLDNKKIFTTKRSIISATINMPNSDTSLPFESYMRGTIGYNEKNGTLVVSSSSSSYQQVTYIYKNVNAPDSYETQDDFYAALTSPIVLPAFTNAPYSTGGIEHKERGVVTVCDNGDIIVVKMIPSKGMYSYKVTYDEATDAYTVPTSVLATDTWTTTYGVEQGNAYGIRHTISNDQTKVIIYCSAYYYGAGYYLHIVDVKTGKVLKYSQKDSSYGYQFIPIFESNLIINKSINADGNKGMSIYMIDIESQLESMSSGAEVGDLSIGSIIQGVFNNAYTSTDYPIMINLNSSNINKYITQGQ